MDIVEQFAYLTHPDGIRFQVLIRDEDGNPIDTDMEATAAAYAVYDSGHLPS